MAQDNETLAVPDAPVAPVEGPRRRRGRRALRMSLRGLWLLLALPLVLVLILPFLLIGQEISAPSWIRKDVEAQVAEVLGGGRLTFGKITVTVARDLHPTVRIYDAVLEDAEARVLARVPMVEGLVSPRGLLLERSVLPQVIVLQRAEMALHRGADGALALAFEGAGPERGGGTLAEVLDAVDAALEQPALAALEEVRIEGLILNYDDARAGRSWVVDDARLTLRTTSADVHLRGDFALLSGRDFVTTFALDYSSPRGSRAAELSLDIDDAPAVDVGVQSPALSWLSVLEARVSARMRASVDAGGQLGPLFATVDIGAGRLQPEQGARALGFEGAKAYLRFDPAEQRILFEQVELSSDWGDLRAEGQAYLRDLRGGLPETLLGQFRVLETNLNPAGLYEAAPAIRTAFADFRLRLDPFVIEVGHLGLTLGEAEARAEISGTVRATSEGWDVAAQGEVDRLSQEVLMAVWPQSVAAKTRGWFERNMLGGVLTGLNGGLRLSPGQAPVWALTHGFEGAEVRVMRQWPPVAQAAGTVTLQDNSLTVMVEAGRLPSPVGGGIDLSGSVFTIPVIGIPEAPAEISLRGAGAINAALSILDQPPFGFLTRAGLPVDLAAGTAVIEGEIRLPLMRNVPRERISYAFEATLADVATSGLVPGRRLASSQLAVAVDRVGLVIRGPVQTGAARGVMTWRQVFGTPGSRVSADVELSQGFLDEFGIALPPGMISGSGTGALRIDLARGQPPAFSLSTNLAGLSMRLPALGWSKGAGSRGALELRGVLGETPRIDRIALDVAGLQAEGRITLRPGGGLERAQFSTVRLGGWLNAGVALVGRGAGQPVGVEVSGGALDLRAANFGQSGAQSGPMSVSLDRLRVTDGITLDRFRGQFDGGRGLNGQFTALLGGSAPVRGVLASEGGGTGLRLLSEDAGAVLAAAGLLETAQGGALELTLRPAGSAGSYDGVLAVTDLRVREAPALAALLDAISVVGLLQQLDGQGLRFTNVDAQFRLTPSQIIVTQSSAVGPGLGISVDGVYTLAGKVMDFQGVISPLYLINGIGAILTRPGEGLFGFNFTLRGPAEQVQVGVNPLSVLTPGMFREIFRRPVPVVE